jgi:hypothetical protein
MDCSLISTDISFPGCHRHDSGPGLADQAMHVIDELKQLAAAVEPADKRLFFTMRLLYLEDSDSGFAPKGFAVRTISSFHMSAGTDKWECGRVSTPFAGFLMKVDTGVRVRVE